MQAELPRVSFNSWLRDFEPLSYHSDQLTLAAANAYACELAQHHYGGEIERVLAEIVGLSP